MPVNCKDLQALNAIAEQLSAYCLSFQSSCKGKFASLMKCGSWWKHLSNGQTACLPSTTRFSGNTRQTQVFLVLGTQCTVTVMSSGPKFLGDLDSSGSTVKQFQQDTQALNQRCTVLSHEWKTNTALFFNITISMYAYLVSSPVQANLCPALRSAGDD